MPYDTAHSTDVDLRLAELEAKLAAIGRSQMIIEFDLHGSVLSANENFLTTFGYAEHETVGRHHAMFVDAETLASREYRLFWERLADGQYTSQEYKRIGKGGREIWIQASYNPILDGDGKPYKVIKYASDVTQSRLISNDYSGQITAISKSQAVVEFDMDGIVLSANQNFLDVVGYDLEDIQGRHHSLLVEPDLVRLKTYEQFWRDLRDGQYHAGEYRRISRSGSLVWLQASYNPILDLNGRPFKIVKYASDITDVVERRQSAAALELSARQAAEMAAAAKTDFLANMSHELRTPLTSILGFSDLIGTTSEISQTDRRYLGLIRSAGQNLLAVVNDILDFSKLEAGAVALNAQPTDLRSLIEDIVSLMWERAEAKGLGLTCATSTDLSVRVDPHRLSQVLLNLIGNAVKFTDVGDVHVQVETTMRPNDQVLLDIRVIDTGPGLQKEKIGTLFQRFTQADESTTRRFGGTGLGLAISQQLVELMGGEIGAESDGRTGSTFWFRLTCPLSECVGAAHPHASPSELVADLRILLADDHPANRILVAALLEPFGITVDTVENGQEAVKAAGTGVYDIILMDMQMPLMDGLTATRAIRALNSPIRHVPILALTANVLPEQVEQCLAAGMQGHVAKPVDLTALIEALHAHAPLNVAMVA